MRKNAVALLLASSLLPALASAQVWTTIEGPINPDDNALLSVDGSGEYTAIRTTAYYYGIEAAGQLMGARISNEHGNAQLQLVPGGGVGPSGPSWGPTEAGTFHVDGEGTLWYCSVGGTNPTWIALNKQAPPAGAVMFFNLAACPAGWTELTAARGRTVVGRPSGGTLGGTVGTALANLENRSHNHTFTASVGNAVVTAHAGWTHYGYNDTGTFVTDTGVDENHGDQHNHSASGTTGSTADVTPYLQLLACQKN